MNQRDLNREISRATGESVSTIAGMGFVELRPIPFEQEPLTMDWDEHDAERTVSVTPQRRRHIPLIPAQTDQCVGHVDLRRTRESFLLCESREVSRLPLRQFFTAAQCHPPHRTGGSSFRSPSSG